MTGPSVALNDSAFGQGYGGSVAANFAGHASVLAGDVVVCVMMTEPGGAPTPPTMSAMFGFTQEARVPTNTSGGADNTVLLLWKRSTGAEPASYLFDWSGYSTLPYIYFFFVLRGCQTTGTPFEGSNGTGTVTAPGNTTPDVNVTTTDANRLLIMVPMMAGYGNWTATAGWSRLGSGTEYASVWTQVAASANTYASNHGIDSSSSGHAVTVITAAIPAAVTHSATVALTASPSLSAAALHAHRATAALTGAASLSTTGRHAHTGRAAFAGAPDLGAAAHHGYSRRAALAAPAQLDVAAGRGHHAGAVLGANPMLTVEAHHIRSGLDYSGELLAGTWVGAVADPTWSARITRRQA